MKYTTCDICGKATGCWDFYGDYICVDCCERLDKPNVEMGEGRTDDCDL
jgi:hypothetical protein